MSGGSLEEGSPGWGVRLMSWSRNWPNCITMWLSAGGGLLQETRWMAELMALGLGRLEGFNPPRGMFRLLSAPEREG